MDTNCFARNILSLNLGLGGVRDVVLFSCSHDQKQSVVFNIWMLQPQAIQIVQRDQQLQLSPMAVVHAYSLVIFTLSDPLRLQNSKCIFFSGNRHSQLGPRRREECRIIQQLSLTELNKVFCFQLQAAVFPKDPSSNCFLCRPLNEHIGHLQLIIEETQILNDGQQS